MADLKNASHGIDCIDNIDWLLPERRLDAHIDKKNRRYHSLVEHSKAVAILTSIAAAKLGMKSLGYLIGLLHDFGKYRMTFQRYLREPDEDKQRLLRGTINHSAAGAQWLQQRYANPNNVSIRLTLEALSLVISGHHSGLTDCLSVDGIDRLEQRIYPKADIELAECEQNFILYCAAGEIVDDLFRKSVAEVEQICRRVNESVWEKGEISCRLFLTFYIRSLLSCLMDADRYDAFVFIADKEMPAPVADKAFWAGLQEQLETHLQAFENTRLIDRLRWEIADACLAAAERPSGIYRLFAPTGGGKTLSSLRFALKHAQVQGKKRIFYIIPYTSIIDQVAQEFKQVFGDVDFILEHHSNRIWEEDASAEELEQRELYTERWHAPIVLTTMVQFLNTVFAGSNSCSRRMHNLAESIFVFDEIQALPLNCVNLFNAACNFLANIGGASIVLCTATQPELAATKIPLQFAQATDIVPRAHGLAEAFRRTQIIDTYSAQGEMDTAALTQFLAERGAENNNLLVVLNTKQAALTIYQQLRRQLSADYIIYHLSTSMCAAHRLAILAKIKKQLSNKRVICISTQLIEAGINISFACVVRSLAGLDNIAQAAGRCNRHGEDERLHKVYIISYIDENLAKLPAIRNAQIHCKQVLSCSTEWDGDLLCPEAIKKYYRLYFGNAKNAAQMNYPLFARKIAGLAENTDLVELLSVNNVGLQAAPTKHSRWILRQAFQTAGQYFTPFEQETQSIFVPYNDHGAKLLAKLSDQAARPTEILKSVRQAQPYFINIYPGTMEKLRKQQAITLLPCGIWALGKKYYSEESGLIMEFD